MGNKETEKIYVVNKVSLIITIICFLIFWLSSLYIYVEYINVLKNINEPILLFIGLIAFIYFILPRVFNESTNIINNIKFNRRYKYEK